MKKAAQFLLLFLISFYANSQNIDENGFIRHYVGTINKNSKISMNLYSFYSKENQKNITAGNYFYENNGEIVKFYGETDRKGNITLTESDERGIEIARITGKINGTKFIGNWQSIDGIKKYELNLSEDYTNSVEFKSYNVYRQYFYKNDKEYYPYELEYFYCNPIKYSNNSVIEKIQRDLTNKLFNDDSDNIEKTLKDYFNEKIKTYNNDAAELEEGQEDIDKTSTFYAWSMNSFTIPYFNDRQILSIQYSSYEFSGGAHGDSIVNFYVYDLKTGDKITKDQIFKKNTQRQLRDILLKKLDLYCLNVKGESSDLIILDRDSVQPNDNFYLTNKGIGFYYNVYDLSVFAVGEFDIFIPYTEIKDIIKEGSPIENFIKN